jgi:hypothetical protein
VEEMQVTGPERTAAVAASMPRRGLESFSEIVATPRDGGVLELVTAWTGRLRSSRHRYAVDPETRWATPRITTDGLRWTEVDGPTGLWSAMGTAGGLSQFFPPLPRDGEVGATALWELTRGDAADVQATEKRRGRWGDLFAKSASASPAGNTMAAKDNPRPRYTVRLERWSEEGGQRVAHLSMTGDFVQDAGGKMLADAPEMTMHVEGRYEGTYEVLASGRLLSATVTRTMRSRMTAGGEPLDNVSTMKGRASLVAACDGPTRASLAAPVTREERAIAAWYDAWKVAWAQPDKAAALRHFDDTLRKKHGDEALWRALADCRALRGDRALAPATIFADDDVSSDEKVVRLRIGTVVAVPGEAGTNTAAVLDVELRESAAGFLVSKLGLSLPDPTFSLLELSPARVLATRAWRPSSARAP